ncbi:MAG: arginine--tRNA ligase [Candidatus Zixiibacteriota bacterium]
MTNTTAKSYFQDVCDAAAAALKAVGVSVAHEDLAASFEAPNKKGFGDAALPCFPYARELKMPPPKIAERLAEVFERPPSVVKVAAMSGYLNVWYDPGVVANEVLPAIQQAKQAYGASDEGHGRTICMDYSHPNIAKPFGVGHLRSTVIGNSLKRILEHHGFTTVGINHLGDWGTQFGKLIVAYREWGDEAELRRDPIKHLYNLYVRIHQEAEHDSSWDERGRREFKKLEDGDAANRELWQQFRDLSLREFERVYKRLGVTFESDAGEAFYESRLTPLIDRLVKEKHAIEGEDGALVIPIRDSGDDPPLLLRKADGATTYATRDLAAAEHRFATYHFYRCLYIVGSAQALHFKQLFSALKQMGHDWADRMLHIDFGWVKFADSMMSTRKGNIIFLNDVLSEAVEKTRSIIAERNPDLENADEVAEQVGVGAIVFWMLSVKRQKDVNFDWDEVLSFDGRTGPYLQYTHARVCSLLARYGQRVPSSGVDFGTLSTDEERQLLLQLADWPRRIAQAIRFYEPQILASALLDMAQAYNRFYQNVRILDGDPEALPARIVLADSLRIVLNGGLYLLGMGAPQRM